MIELCTMLLVSVVLIIAFLRAASVRDEAGETDDTDDGRRIT